MMITKLITAIEQQLATPELAAKTLSLPQMHGFLTALATVLERVSIPKWLPLLFTQHPELQRTPAGEQLVALAIKLYHECLLSLTETGSLHPIAATDRIGIEHLTDEELASWCNGYSTAVSLTQDQWFSPGHEAMRDVLEPIMHYADDAKAQKESLNSPPNRDDIAMAIQQAKAFWRIHQHCHHHHPQPPLRRPEAKIGRNDACVCGSGKKYKKCCGRV